MTDTERRIVEDSVVEASRLLAEAQQRLGSDDFAGALDALDSASSLVPDDSPLAGEIKQTQRDVERRRKDRRTTLLHAVHQALTSEPFSEEKAIWAIEDLNRFEPDSPDAARAREELAERTRKVAEEREYQELKTRLEAIWREAEKGEARGAGGVGVLERYKLAHDLATVAAANYPSSLGLSGLERDALKRHTLARGRHEKPTTLQEAGAYREAIQHLKQVQEEQGGDARVTFVRDPTRPESTETTTVDEALEIVRRAAQRWADQKAQEYQDEADKLIAAHSPSKAAEKLNDGLALFQLDEEARARLRDQLVRVIQPAMQRREEAEELLGRWDRAKPAEAWDLVVKAGGLDAHTPGLEDARRQVRTKLRGYIETDLLAQAKTWLNKANWQQARELVDEATKLIQRDNSFEPLAETARQLHAECLEWERLSEEVTDSVTRLREQAQSDPKSAADRLKGLLEHWGEKRSKHFAELTELRTELQAKVDLEQLVAQVELAIRSENHQTVAQAVVECEAAISANPVQRLRLERLLERLRLHKRYLEGLRLLDQNQVPQGLKLLKQVVDQDGDDKEAADQRSEEIISDQKTEAEVTATLAKARRAMDQGRPDEAFRALNPWRNRPTQHSQEVILLLETASRAWEQRIISVLEGELRSDKLDVARVITLVQDLGQTLGSSLAPEWERQALSRCAVQQAEEFEQAGRWDDAVTKWAEAKSRNPDSVHYEIRWRQAQKQAAWSKAQSSETAETEAEEVLLNLEREQPTDPEIKKWLAQHYLEQAKSAEGAGWAGQLFERALQKAQEGLRLIGATTPRRWAQELQDLTQRIEVEEEIRRQQWEAQRLLLPSRSVDDYVRARKLGEELAAKPGRRDLNRWWWDLRRKTLETAESHLAEEEARGTEIWEGLRSLGHILALESEHGQAKDKVGALYGEVLKLQEKLGGTGGLTKNKTGRGYGETDKDALDAQLAETLSMEQRLNLAYQMLNHFGGYVQDGKKLREQVGGTYLRTSAGLVSTLNRFKQLVGDVEAGIGQAKMSDDWRMVNDALTEIREDLGYAQHRTVSYLEKKINAVKQKRQQLEACRREAEKAAAAEDFEVALDWLARMRGCAPEHLLTDHERFGHFAKGAAEAEESDPNDEYGEQSKVSIIDPYTGRRVVGLCALVPLLRKKQQQVEDLERWLARVVDGSLHRQSSGQGEEEEAREWVERKVAAAEVIIIFWNEIEADVNDAIQRGDFEAARELCQQAQHGEGDTELVHDRHPLALAVSYLQDSPVNRSEPSSLHSEKLLEQGLTLLDHVRHDLETCYQLWESLDGTEQEWHERYDRFMNILSALEGLGGLCGWLRPKKRRHLRQEAFMALAKCQEICPHHPNLQGWESHPLLQ